MATPPATKLGLLTTLALTAVVAADYLRRARTAAVDADLTGAYLAILGVLFCARVVGQVYVRARSPAWLPPTEQWNLLPYRLLLPTQLLFVALIAAIVADFLAGPWLFAEPLEGAGVFLIALSAVYAASMLVRYALRMARRPDERWFGGTIPIVFHIVLATFLLVWGAFGVSH